MNKRLLSIAVSALVILAAITSCVSSSSNPEFATNTEGNSGIPGPAAETESHFGMGGGLPKFADELRDSGSEITRVWISWDKIEPANDQYNWAEMDEIVTSANERNIEVLGFFYSMPTWARNKASPGNKTIKGKPADPGEPVNWDDYTEFARNVAERYDGNHGHGEMKYIEIWNEVQGFAEMNSKEYEPWLIRGYQAAKQGNPDVQILLGAVHSPMDFNGGYSGQTTEEFIAAMLRDYSQYYDIFNFHIYQRKDGAVGEAVDYMKGLMKAYNVNKPMWITETATFWPNVVCDNLAWRHEAARGVIKRYAQALGNGVEKVFWYSFTALPTVEEDPSGVEGGKPADFLMGGLGWVFPKGQGLPIDEFHPRPAFNTYKLMTSKLSGFSSVEKITDTQYKFIVNGKNIYVLWSDKGSDSLPSGISGLVKVTDYLGNEEIRQASQIVLSGSPIFIE